MKTKKRKASSAERTCENKKKITNIDDKRKINNKKGFSLITVSSIILALLPIWRTLTGENSNDRGI